LQSARRARDANVAAAGVARGQLLDGTRGMNRVKSAFAMKSISQMFAGNLTLPRDWFAVGADPEVVSTS
jgi:hypothetical protein